MSQPASTVVEPSQILLDNTPLPTGWRYVRLNEVARVFAGSAAPQDSKYFCDVGVPFVRVSDLGVKRRTTCLKEIRDKVSEEAINTLQLVHAKAGTILFPKSGAAIVTNNRAILGVDAYIVSHLMAVEPSDKVDTHWLYWILCQIDMRQYSDNDAYPSLKQSVVSNIKIPFPPLEERRRIATVINEKMVAVERARAAAEAQLKAAKDLPAAYLREVFESSEAQEWQRKKIGEICAVTKLAGFEYTKYVKYVPDGEYIALRAQNVRNEGLDLRNVVRISKKVASVLYRSKLDKNDVVMTFIGANIGEATWITESDTFYCAPNIAKITPNPEFVDYRFLTLAIQSRSFQQQIQEINASTAQQSLSMRDIRNFTVPVPSLEEQRHIAARLLECHLSANLLRERLQEQLDAIQPLPATFLRQAFTGKL